LLPVQNDVNTAIMRTDLGELSAISYGEDTEVILSVEKIGEDKLFLKIIYHNNSLNEILPYNTSEITITACNDEWELRNLEVYPKAKMVSEHKSHQSTASSSFGRWIKNTYDSIVGVDYDDYEQTQYFGDYGERGYDAISDGSEKMVEYDPSDPYHQGNVDNDAIPRKKEPKPNDFFERSKEDLEASLLDRGGVLPKVSMSGMVMAEYNKRYNFAYSIVIPFGYDVHQFVFVPSFEENRYYQLQKDLHPENPPQRLRPIDLNSQKAEKLEQLIESNSEIEQNKKPSDLDMLLN
jgi:hypothetical protein